MRYTSLVIILLLMAILPGKGYSQGTPLPIKELRIGDKIPDAEISKLLNSKEKSIKLSDLYKNGLLIIDFWATWCGPCVRELPIVDSLAGKYKSLKILSVSHDDSVTSTAFLAKHAEINTKNIVVSSDDKKLSQWFRHKSIPHNVWIDRDGIVRLISQGDAIIDKNIKLFLSGRMPNIKVKKDDVNFKFWKPYHVDDSLLEYRSIFTHFNDSITSGIVSNGPFGNGSSKRVFIYNGPITRMYWVAYVNQLSSEINWDFIELHTRDSTRFLFPTDNKGLFERSRYNQSGLDISEQKQKWTEDNLFCYDLILPKPVPDTLFTRYMFEDLNRFFNVDGRVKLRSVNCSVLTKNKSFNSLSIKQTTVGPDVVLPVSEYFKLDGKKLIIRNRNLTQIVGYFNFKFRVGLDFPFVNETGIDYPIDLTMDLSDLPDKPDKNAIIKIFNNIGLEFVREVRTVPVLVLYDLSR